MIAVKKLRITGGDFPEAVEIQFSLNEKSGSVITRTGTTKDNGLFMEE